VYKLSRTVPVNEGGKSFLSRHDVWNGLLMKANNALPYVPIMTKCDVVEKGAGWLVRDIIVNQVPLREKVTFEPESKVIFERIGGEEPGRIENVIGEDANGNLTLTFSFGLTKKGIPEGSEAETQHFAPMEGAYMGAVVSTLGAVRRTVDEQGREKLPAAADIDAHGDNGWIYEFFRSADSLNMDRLTAHLSPNVKLTFANYPTASGVEAFRGAIGGLWSRIKGMSHSVAGAWSMHDGKVGISQCTVMYTRLDDSMYLVNVATIFRRDAVGKIYDLRICADTTAL
jgi:Domain of unknown function (DUF1857)